MSENTDKRTATQRIEDLEKVVTMLYQATAQNKPVLENLLKSQTNSVNDLNLIKEALKLLNKKTEAIVQAATPESGITPTTVSTLLVKMNVDDLTALVAGYIANGHIVPADTIADNSFVVAEELNSDGTLG